MELYKCPSCEKVYSEFDNIYYCPICRYRLKKIDSSFSTKQQPSSKPTVECQYCHSANTKKISGTKRWFSTGLFGLASNKIGKNFHCNNCKSDF